MPTDITANVRQDSPQSSASIRTQQAQGTVDTTGQAIQKRQELQDKLQSLTSAQLTSSEIDSAKLGKAVEDLSSYVQNLQRELNFSVDQNSGRTVIKVIDSETDEVIRQIPPEEVMEIAEYFSGPSGILMNAKV